MQKKGTQRKIKRFDMSSKNGRMMDINLYITGESELYTRPHTHSFFEFIVVLKGKLRQSINGNERILSENDLCVLRPEARHTIERYENSPFLLYNFEVNVDYLNTLCSALGLCSADKLFETPENYARCSSAELLEYIKVVTTPNLLSGLAQAELKEASSKIIITKILTHFVLNPAHDLMHKKEDSAISTMLELLEDEQNFTRTIKELCEQTFYTQEHITRLFKKANLNSPNRVHLQKKLQHAANLLLNSDMKIIDIAERCGIETVSYFTKTFKKEYGMSPSTYKKLYRKNIDS